MDTRQPPEIEPIQDVHEQAAMREIAEETGMHGEILAPLGVSEYWFRAQDLVVDKTVHHYLLRYVKGELRDDNHEVEEVAWVPLHEAPSRFTHADERKVGQVAARFGRCTAHPRPSSPTSLAAQHTSPTVPNAFDNHKSADQTQLSAHPPSRNSGRTTQRSRQHAIRCDDRNP